MTREEYIKTIIKQKGYNTKTFAEKINLPYTTLLSILNRSIGGASVDNAIKICQGLGITVEELEQYGNNNSNEIQSNIILTEQETLLIQAYREQKEMQSAVDRILGIAKNDI